MKILMLEDRGQTSVGLRETLTHAGHDVLKAMSVSDAKSLWKENKVDCIILDLNLDPQGLSPEQTDETHRGLLTGWVWLKHYVYGGRPDMKPHTIIYSAYLAELRRLVPKEELAEIGYLVPKLGPSHLSGDVVDAANSIAKKSREHA